MSDLFKAVSGVQHVTANIPDIKHWDVKAIRRETRIRVFLVGIGPWAVGVSCIIHSCTAHAPAAVASSGVQSTHYVHPMFQLFHATPIPTASPVSAATPILSQQHTNPVTAATPNEFRLFRLPRPSQLPPHPSLMPRDRSRPAVQRAITRRRPRIHEQTRSKG